jgi:diguanylate cyclase (GGDEF)-like protein/PAS domain S-box-containing protein
MGSSKDKFYKDILDNLYDGVYFVDRRRYITFWNKGAERITGFSSERVIGSRCSDNILMHMNEEGTMLCKAGCPMGETIEDGRTREAQVYLHHADGHRVPVLVQVTAIRNDAGEIIGGVESFSDNTSMINTLNRVNELQQGIMRDTLTEIGNRQYIELKLGTCLAEIKYHQTPFGILFIDIDRFKLINDTYGHDVGDKVLKMVTNTLRHNIRTVDYLGRWGGEEFVAIIPNLNPRYIVKIANKLCQLVAGSQLFVEDNNVQVTISIGATLSHPDDTIETVLKRSDRLLYESKAAGRNQVTFME